jgi:putative CocE/NonD family hydrolase
MTNSTLLPTPPAVAVAPPLDQAGEAPEPPAPVHLPRRVRVEQAILSNPWVERIGREAFAASMGISRGPHKVTIERNIAVPMPDGVILIADRYAPQDGGPRPAIIMRTPYNRTGGTVIGGIFPWYFASYGYNVVIQDVRGRFASGGEYAPFLYEAEDGAATVAWTLQQPWCDGAVGMWGASYLGYCQWSAAATAPAGSVKALAPLMTSAWLMRYPENGFPLDLLARWMLQLATMTDPTLPLGERLRRINDAAVQDQLLAAAFNHLPLATADEAAIGHPSPHYRRMAEAERDHPNWRVTNFTDRVAHCPPGDFVSGWYDLFLDGLLDDFCAQQAAGLKPRLTVGPWHHLDLDYMPLSFRSALDWFDTHLRGAPTQSRRKAVRLFVMGRNRWREFDAWPPRASSTQLYLHGSGAAKTGRLRLEQPSTASAPDHYRYDPADPTPNLGGPKMGSDAGAVDNRTLEARRDVLVFTTTPLTRDLEVIGPIYADLYVRSSTLYTDFFARLCVVDRHGRSLNVCDGNLRLEPGQGEPQPDGSLRVRVALSSTAYCFRAGQRIRLQVSSGAHPRFARNLGTGEPLATGVHMVVAEQTLYHDAAHPSALVLPVVRQGEP